MQKIRDMIVKGKNVYIILETEKSRSEFMIQAEKEGITFSDGTKPTEKKAEDIMCLRDNGTICYLGWAGRIRFHNKSREKSACVVNFI
ncbi:MAG: hypothetical protein E7536_10400 [Ruminococcaceae bacterium]|nr:hypothetical protein [Oscillospiraceae bacterium]